VIFFPFFRPLAPTNAILPTASYAESSSIREASEVKLFPYPSLAVRKRFSATGSTFNHAEEICLRASNLYSVYSTIVINHQLIDEEQSEHGA